MQTEHLVAPAITWLKERPSLAKEQLENPIFSLQRAREEIDELIEAISQGMTREDIKGELTDVFNFIACAEYILFKQFAFTEAELVDQANFTYGTRNAIKYPAHNYQNGVPPKQSLKADVNRWELAKIYQGSGFNLNPEYY